MMVLAYRQMAGLVPQTTAAECWETWNLVDTETNVLDYVLKVHLPTILYCAL